MMSPLLPGDLFDPYSQAVAWTDHAVGTITTMTVAQVVPDALVELSRDSRTVARGLRRNNDVAMATLHEWIASFGLRSAPAKSVSGCG